MNTTVKYYEEGIKINFSIIDIPHQLEPNATNLRTLKETPLSILNENGSLHILSYRFNSSCY